MFSNKANDSNPNLDCVNNFKGKDINELKHMFSTTFIYQETAYNPNQYTVQRCSQDF